MLKTRAGKQLFKRIFLHLLYDTDARRFDACKQTLDDLHSKLNKVMVGYCCARSASLDFNLMPNRS
jgi:hypothetical protein